MGRHTVLGMVVHGLGANLDFDGPAIGIAHHRVQRLVTIGFGSRNVVVKLFGDGREMFVHPAQGLITIGHFGHHHTQGADVKYPFERQRLAPHLLDDAVDVFGPAAHLRGNALRSQGLRQALAKRRHVLLAFCPFLIQKPGDLLVGLRLQEAERQILQLPFDLPNAQAVGQGRKHIQRFTGQRRRDRQLGRGIVAQGLHARSQPQHHHTQVARKRQQHLAHVFRLNLGVVDQLCRALGRTRQLLKVQQLVGLQGQLRQVGSKSLGDHLFRLVQMRAGIHQIPRCLHLLGATDPGQNARNRIGVLPDVLSGVELLALDQGTGKSAGTLKRALCQLRGGSGLQHRGRCQWEAAHVTHHTAPSKKSATSAMWTGSVSVGA